MRPTAEFVGLAACYLKRAVARLLSLRLKAWIEGILCARSRCLVVHGSGTGSVKTSIPLKLLLLAALFCCTQLDGALDPYSSEFEKSPPPLDSYFRDKAQQSATERQELFRKRVAIPDAVADNVPLAFPTRQPTRQPGDAATPGMDTQSLVIAALSLVVAFLGFQKLAPDIGDYLNRRFNPWVLAPSAAGEMAVGIRSEDAAFSEFLTTLQAGPAAMSGTSPFGLIAPAGRNPVEEFFADAPRLLRQLHKLLREIIGASDDAVRRKMLADLEREVRVLKGEAGLPELLPVWQLASALEGLLRQLLDRAANITASTLRTVNGGVDLLADLCTSQLNANLLAESPIRLLVVDDDLISRKALALALKKLFNPPDLAENGEAALALATQHAYDVIFLDVQMPGMDGFEVCTRIHDTIPNAITPVVFVTSQSDFDARARSTLCGGSDLIGKPFLTFEITVKALTLALRRRLQGRPQIDSTVPVTSLAWAQTRLAQHSQPERSADAVKAMLPETLTDKQQQGRWFTGGDAFAARGMRDTIPVSQPAAVGCRSSADLSPEQLTQAFLARAAAQLGSLRELIQAIFQTTDENARQDMLADFYIRFNALTPKAGSAAEHPALRLSAALEGLLKKLLQDPKVCTSSTLVTIATAVDLLNDLCALGLTPDLGNKPPIQIMAVDDDPVARRAITGTLQMAFEKPASVESGEAALALASGRAFDVIFLDVQMPGLDGFTTCLRIHETVHNRTTPVVFVTGQSDFKARSQSTVSGGSDLIGKPFITAEITVKALTYALRGRLQKLKSTANAQQFQSANGHGQSDLLPAFSPDPADHQEGRARSRASKKSRKRERQRSVSTQNS